MQCYIWLQTENPTEIQAVNYLLENMNTIKKNCAFFHNWHFQFGGQQIRVNSIFKVCPQDERFVYQRLVSVRISVNH